MFRLTNAAAVVVLLAGRGPATPAPADAEADPIGRVLKLDAEADRLARAAAAEPATLAAERKAALRAIDPRGKTRPHEFAVVVVGRACVTLREYDADCRLLASATGSPAFVERYFARGRKAGDGPTVPAVHVAADARPELVAETFAALHAGGAGYGWLTGTLPDTSGATAVERPASGGERRFAAGRVVYVQVMVDFRALDAAGRPEVVRSDRRC